MKICFFGTPEFSVPTLKALVKNYEVTCVITQPDKPKGRGNKIIYSPIKELALELNIPVLQPVKVKDPDFIEELKTFEADVFVVIAYGQILPKAILDMPRLGSINIHGSLLPKYRGPAPIHHAIINGETITGITIMQMDTGLDTGDMLLKKEIFIKADYTSGTLYEQMSILGAKAIIETFDLMKLGRITSQKQNDKLATYAPMLDKEMGHINWNNKSDTILNLIRGLNPWPSAYTNIGQAPIKIWQGKKLNTTYPTAQNGEVVKAGVKEGIVVKTADGSLLLTEVQGAGGKKMDTKNYLMGNKIPVGTILD